MELDGKRILLIVGGGIAAYKSLDLIRRLRACGAAVRCILTAAGAEFVTPLSLAALSEDKVFRDLFDLTTEAEMGHISLSREADLIVVAPATADLMAKMAAGSAGDLATTTLLATDKPVMVAPAMNVRMWCHPATRRNLQCLHADGIITVGPNEGPMACNEHGFGRMAEPAEIVEAVIEHIAVPAGAAAGRGWRALVTSGPTHEAIDPVRYIANRSSGRQGHAIAEAFQLAGFETVLVSGPTALPDPAGVHVEHVESAADMLRGCQAVLPVDVAVCAAAVADWRLAAPATRKLKKTADQAVPSLELVENPDILATLSGSGPGRPRLIVGFAAETDRLLENATAKRARKGCDWILANAVGPHTGTFGGTDNDVYLVTDSGVEDWPKMSKADVGRRLVARVVAALEGATP